MPDAIVLFRRIDGGEFYEAFEDDADTVARALSLKTTFIGNTWLVSFAAELLEPYLAKLIGTGHRVALCERDTQVEHDRFLLRNAKVKQQEPPVFTALPKGRQKPLLRGLQDSPGQMNLFPGMDVA
jgi:DNA mismatch repair ATPase MutS